MRGSREVAFPHRLNFRRMGSVPHNLISLIIIVETMGTPLQTHGAMTPQLLSVMRVL